MTKRPLCLGAAGVLSGILAAAYGWSVFVRALLACGVLACGILGGIFAGGYRPGDGISPAERKRTAFGAGVFLLMFALGSGRYLEAEESRQAYLGELQDGMYVTVQGQLAGKQIQKNRYVYELTSCMFRTDSSNFLQTEPVSCGGVLIYSDSDDCSIGDILIYHGEITLWKRASNEGAFDAKAYYFARGFDFAMEGAALDRKVCAKRQTAEALWQLGQRIKEVYLKTMGERDAGILATMVVGDREFLDAETKRLYQIGGLSHILAISGVKTLKLDIPLVLETRINWGFVPLHIAIIYILKLCLGEEIIPRCRFPCSRGYLIKCINWQKKQSFSVSQSYRKS